MNRGRGLGIVLVFCLLPVGVNAEWQVSGDHRAGYVQREQMEDTHTVQPWGVDTVSGATQKIDQKFWMVETNITAAHTEDSASRLAGIRYLGGKDFDTPYTHPRLSNLILAWHGSAGALEAGYVLTPLSWGRGLVVNRMRYSGGHALIDWGNSGHSEGFWTDTLEDPARFRYAELSQAGFRQVALIPAGEISVAVVDTSRTKVTVFPKQGKSSRGTFIQASVDIRPEKKWRVYSELSYARLLEGTAADARAGVVGGEYAVGSWFAVSLTGWYLGKEFNPATGYYNVYGEEEGQAHLECPMMFFSGQLRITPGFGWLQRWAGNFWIPLGEIQWYCRGLGLTVKAYETAEQPVNRWGDEDHREYTGISAGWEAWGPLSVTGRWEKIYDGFSHAKTQQWSGEISVRY
jgi:hypothetical protein